MKHTAAKQSRTLDEIVNQSPDPNWRCSHCGGDHHDKPRMNSMECAIQSQYGCPRCGVRPGEFCIDVRMHNARKTQYPPWRELRRVRSAQRHR